MSNQPSIAQQIIDLRARLGLTQAELGARLGITGSAVGQWEQGVTTPRGKHRTALARLDREAREDHVTTSPELSTAEPYPEMTLAEYSLIMRIGGEGQADFEVAPQQVVELNSAPNYYDDPDVIAAVSMHVINGMIGPDLRALESFGFNNGSVNQALSHVPSIQGPWTWPRCKRSYIALVRELIGQLTMMTMSSLDGDTLKETNLNIARLEVVADRLERGDVVAVPAIPAEHNPQTVTIDWQALVREHHGVRGVSLRHLVGLGLYGKYQDAAAALERDPRNLTHAVKFTSADGGRGPAANDWLITDMRTVQRFCSRANTDMGHQIADLIIDHHNELQAMLSGDPEAQSRHEQAKAPAPTDNISALRAMLDEMERQRDAIAAQQQRQQQFEREVEVTRQSAQLAAELVNAQDQRLSDVETRLNTAPIAGHLTAYQIAERGGYMSSTGRPHASAVVALGDIMGLEEEGEAYRVMTEINDHICPSRRYTPVGAAMLSRELSRLARVNDDPFFNVVAGAKTYTVYKAQ